MQSPSPSTPQPAVGSSSAAASFASPSAARSFSPARRGMRPSGTTGALWTLASPAASAAHAVSAEQQQQQQQQQRSKLITATATRGVDWALVSAGSEAVVARSRSRVAAAQPSVMAAADDLMSSVLQSIDAKEAEQAEERRMQHAAPDAATLLAQNRVSTLQFKARRSAAARLERKLLRDLDTRHPTPLSALPQHVNVNVRPTAQAYAGKVERMRNVLELRPSNFKSVHAHVQAHFVHGAAFDLEDSSRDDKPQQRAHVEFDEDREQRQGPAEDDDDEEEDESKTNELELEPPLPVRSYAADQAQRKVAAHVRSASRTLNLNLFPPGSPKATAALIALTASASAAGAAGAPLSPTGSKVSSRSHARSGSTASVSSLLPSSTAGAASPAPSSRAASPLPASSSAAAAFVPPIAAMLQSTAPLPPSAVPYNRFGTLRPSVVAEFKTFQREVAALPPRLNPNPLRDMWAAPSQQRSSSKLDPQMAARQAKKHAMSSSRSQPILLSRELPPKQHTPRGLDFAYTPDAPDLLKALSGLPVPLPTAHPSMFAFEYAPPMAAKAKGTTAYTPRGEHLTIEARGYSSSERVGLMVDNFRAEQAQADAHTAWLAGFKQAYESEQRAKKTLAAKAIWAEAVAEQARRDAAGPETVVHTAESSFRDESDRLEAAQKRKPQRVHLLSVPTGAAGAAAGAAAATLLASSSTSVLPHSRRASASPSPEGGDRERSSTASSRRTSRPPAISTTRSTATADPKASPTGSAGDDTPSPTTPEGFYFTSKLNLQSYNKKQMERQLGLNPLAHAYDSDDDQWVHGVASSDDEAGSDEEAIARKEQADAEMKDRDQKMERMLREVMAYSRAAAKAEGAKLTATSAAGPLPTRKPGKQLNVARFVMANPARRKAKLAQGEHGYARGNGFVSAAAEREKVEAVRKERESRHAENAARHQAAQIAEAERRKQERVAARLQAMQPGASVGLSGSSSAAALTGPDAPLVYTGVEPSWLRTRADYKHEFLPRSQAFLAINSMEKPLAIRSAAERRNITEYLRTLPYLCEFDSQPQLQSELIALARLQPAKKGELLYKVGDTQTSMFILLAGSVRCITRPAGSNPAAFASPSPSSGYSTRSNAPNSSARGANSIVTNRRRPLTPLAAQSQRSPFTPTAAGAGGAEGNNTSNMAVQNMLVAAASSPSPTNSPPLPDGTTEEQPATTSQRPDLPRLDTSAPGDAPAESEQQQQQTANDGADNLDPAFAAVNVDGSEVDLEADMAAARLFASEDPLGQMTPRSKSQRLHHLRHGSMGGTFLSKRGMQLSPGKRAWSAARSRAAKAAAAASDDHGMSDPTSTIVLLQPGSVFGQSREAALLKEAEDAAARALDARLTPAARRWKRLADSIRVKKSLLRSFQKAEQEVEGMGGRSAATGAASSPQQPSPSQAADGSNPEVRRGGRRDAPTASMLAARCRQETIVCASDDTVLIAISLADHDRIMQSSLDRKHHAQVLALKAMQIFQQPAAAAMEQERQKQQLQKNKAAASSTRRSSLKSLASLSTLPLSLSLSPWKIKHLVQLVPHLIPQRYPPGALIAEEDTLGHTLWLIVSGSIQVWKDVELLTYTRLPSGPNEPATVVETRKFRRIHVATRNKGDSIAEEAVCGAPKLDFTYKASGHAGGTHGGVELLAIPRHCFLPFFRRARLEFLKARVSTQRSAAVNFINRIAQELLPGNLRDQIGLGGPAMSEALIASAAAQQASDTPQHVINVNMLESLADDLRGDDAGSRPNNRRRSRPMFSTPQRNGDSPTQQPLSPPPASVEQVRSGGPEWTNISGTSPHHAASGSTGSAVASPWVPPTPTSSAPYMRSASTPALASPAAPGLFSSPSSSSLAGAVSAVSPVAALQSSPAEHRPHSPARYGSAIKVAARIVTASGAVISGGGSKDKKKPKGPESAVSRRITFAEELSSGRDSSRSTTSSLGSSSDRAGTSSNSNSGISAAQLRPARTTLAALELTPAMLNSGGLMLADAEVTKLQQAQAAAAEAQAAAAAQSAAIAASLAAPPAHPSGSDRRLSPLRRSSALSPVHPGGFSPMPESIAANASFASAVSMQSRPETRTLSADKPGGKVDSTPKLSVSFAMFAI